MAASNNVASESASARRRSVITAVAPEVFAVKSANTSVPSWHIADEEYQARTHTNSRTMDDAPAGFDFIKRVTISSTRQHNSSRGISLHARSSSHGSHPKAYIGPNMQLRAAGIQDDTRMDEDIPRSRPTDNFVP
jgi:hypothetical protein